MTKPTAPGEILELFKGGYLSVAETIAALDDLIPSNAQGAQVQQALQLAVNIIMASEPGDSRAVSNEAVALAAVSCGDTSEPVMKVIRDALAVPSTHQSAPDLYAPRNSGERLPSSDAAGSGADAALKALRPFAYYFELNDCEGRSDGDALEIPVSDLRAARDLLKSLGVDTSLPPWSSQVSSTNQGGGK
jgi:hypothetical protein